MPPILSILGVDDLDKDSLDFGTIIVYTCVDSVSEEDLMINSGSNCSFDADDNYDVLYIVYNQQSTSRERVRRGSISIHTTFRVD